MLEYFVCQVRDVNAGITLTCHIEVIFFHIWEFHEKL